MQAADTTTSYASRVALLSASPHPLLTFYLPAWCVGSCLFWTIMGPDAGGEPTGTLAEKMKEAFGSFDDFKTQFSAAAAGVFGSGWAWLAVATDGSVKIVTTPNHLNLAQWSTIPASDKAQSSTTRVKAQARESKSTLTKSA